MIKIAPLALLLSAPLVAQTRPAAPAQPRPAAAQPAAEAIARAEFIKNMDRDFAMRDANKDGGVTAAEVTEYQRVAALAAARARNAALFADLDKDKNGTLTAAEFANLPMNMPAPNPNLLMGFDGNRDGKVTLIEYRTGTQGNFDRMDADKDGVVTPAEMRAAGLR